MTHPLAAQQTASRARISALRSPCADWAAAGARRAARPFRPPARRRARRSARRPAVRAAPTTAPPFGRLIVLEIAPEIKGCTAAIIRRRRSARPGARPLLRSLYYLWYLNSVLADLMVPVSVVSPITRHRLAAHRMRQFIRCARPMIIRICREDTVPATPSRKGPSLRGVSDVR